MSRMGPWHPALVDEDRELAPLLLPFVLQRPGAAEALDDWLDDHHPWATSDLWDEIEFDRANVELLLTDRALLSLVLFGVQRVIDLHAADVGPIRVLHAMTQDCFDDFCAGRLVTPGMLAMQEEEARIVLGRSLVRGKDKRAAQLAFASAYHVRDLVFGVSRVAWRAYEEIVPQFERAPRWSKVRRAWLEAVTTHAPRDERS